eukprot:jgi/Botrbrau1/202/Bobra.0022s0182.1
MGLDPEQGKLPSPRPGGPVQPASKGDCLLSCSRFLNGLTVVCALLCIAAHLMAISVAAHYPKDMAGYLRQILRAYAAAFAFIIVLTETEVERILAAFAIFESWMCRSLFQFFVAVLTLYTTRMKDEGEGETDFQKSLQLYRIAAAISLMTCSALYMLGSLLCVGRVKQARSKRDRERLRVQEDLRALDRKRDELRSLLAVYSDA